MPTPDANGRTNGIYIYNAAGSYVTAYVLDSGINTAHQDFSTGFYSRASQAADCITYANCESGAFSPYWNQDQCVYPSPDAINNDCVGHGTHVAGTLGGNTYGVAKGVNIRSIKVGTAQEVPSGPLIAGVNWVTSDHQANPSIPVVANVSISGPISNPNNNAAGVDAAIRNSIAAGVTYVIAAGNNNDNATNYAPGDVAEALTVGAVDWTNNRWANSNWGPSVDLFAPGVRVLSALTGNFMPCAWNGSNTASCPSNPSGTVLNTVDGTSYASPHVAGAVALYLQSRTGTSLCGSYPIQGAAPSFGEFSTCPDRVTQFINANANLNRLSNIDGSIYYASPNRFLWTAALPTRPNPIDNQRFFVWQQYADFLANQPQPDEGGLDWWTNEIIGHGHCSAGVNDSTPCTDVWRVLTSRAFWLASHGELFASNYGLRSGMNGSFVTLCYQIYLRRNPDSGGYNYWLNELSSNYGNPASPEGVFHLIDAFIRSGPPDGYRRRFGP